MAAGAYSDVAILGLTYAEDAVNSYPDSEPEVEAVSHEETAPRMPSFDPECECWCAQEDFVIFSEFSEVQGPLPLLTIPSHVQEDSGFDMNAFILKIMSVDYQANPSGHFILSDDAQVLQLSVTSNLHTYVHYFTLHDIHARGFVRPMCLAYVTTDKIKLQRQFSDLREKFLKVTQVMKFNNRQGFLEDLNNNLHNLKGRQEKYFEWKRQEEEGEALDAGDHQTLMTTDIDQLVQQYTEYKHLQHLVEPTVEDPELQHVISEWQSTCESSDVREVRHFLNKLSRHHVSPGHAKAIRPVLAISPWGCLAALHSLQHVRQAYSGCRLTVQFNVFSTSFTPKPDVPPKSVATPSEALQDKHFLQLIHNLTYPKEWGGDESMDATVASQDDLDYLEAHFLSSGNEGSSSYHSAPSSVTDLTQCTSTHVLGAASSGSSESFLDVSADCSVSSGDGNETQDVEDPTWAGCLWRDATASVQGKPGCNILQFFLEYSQSAQHILYSILIGRTVILSGSPSEQSQARRIANALAPLLPGTKPASILRWHQGIIVPSHIDKFKIIGMCVAERLTVHDMISPKDKNSVTILELGSKQLLGPAYSGQLLSQLKPACVRMFSSDQGVLLLLQAVFTELDSQTFLCRTLGVDKMRDLGVRGCDLSIVKYLASVSSSD